MIAPSQRLLWIAALVVLPATTAAGLTPGAVFIAIAVLAICLIVIVIDAALGVRGIAAVEVGAPASHRLTKDIPGAISISVKGGPVRVALALSEGLESDVKTLAAGAEGSALEWPLTGRTRGDHPISGAHMEMASPLGLWLIRAGRAVSCSIRVYPNMRDKATAAFLLPNRDLGSRMRRPVGKGREFENLRLYVPGDAYEDIHWKATARRRFPMIKTYRIEQAQEVYAVIDCSRLSMREGILDGYIDAALHLALVAERQGDRFGLVTFSDRVHRVLRARSGTEQFRVCRETLYNLRAQRVSPDFREVFSGLQLSLRRRSLLIFFTSLDDALLAETFEREVAVLARQHLVRVNVTQTAGMKPLFSGTAPKDPEEVYEGLAGQMSWNRMRMLSIGLQNRGVRLTVVDPLRMKTQVTDGYLEVKRRQML